MKMQKALFASLV